MADSGVKKFLKVSCLGCLGIVVLAAFALGLFGWLKAAEAEFTEADASYPIEPDETPSPDLEDFPETTPNRVRLMIGGVEEVVVRACEQGENLKVAAAYNENRVQFTERFDEDSGEGWTYTLEMDGGGSQLARIIERLFSGRGNKLDVCLPGDAPIALELDVRDAGMEAELGTLWLRSVDIELHRAGGIVSFDDPLREPAESVSVRTSMAGVLLNELGNASPRRLEVEYRFGALTVDLTGDWRENARVKLEGSASGVAVLVPRSVRVEGVPDMEPATTVFPETAPTLFFAPGTDFDDITVERR